jgi:hypothetical protein
MNARSLKPTPGRPPSLRRHGERGIVSLVVIVMGLALLLTVGLAYDGGRMLAAKVEAANEAAEAARAGAQAISVSDRDSPIANLDPAAAGDAAQAYLAATGHQGTVYVSGDQITVTVTFDEPLAILAVAGINQARVTEAATATATAGITASGR